MPRTRIAIDAMRAAADVRGLVKAEKSGSIRVSFFTRSVEGSRIRLGITGAFGGLPASRRGDGGAASRVVVRAEASRLRALTSSLRAAPPYVDEGGCWLWDRYLGGGGGGGGGALGFAGGGLGSAANRSLFLLPADSWPQLHTFGFVCLSTLAARTGESLGFWALAPREEPLRWQKS